MGSPALGSDGRVYVGADDNALYCIEQGPTSTPTPTPTETPTETPTQTPTETPTITPHTDRDTDDVSYIVSYVDTFDYASGSHGNADTAAGP